MLARTCLVAAVLCACRLHFDERTDGAPGGDSVDGLAELCTAETCNGVDDNCDGEIDEGCPCSPFDMSFSPTVNSPAPAVVWTGTGYLMVARDTFTDFAVYTIDTNGMFTMRTALGDALSGSVDAAVWTGEYLLYGYAMNSATWVVRIDGSGAVVGTASLIGTNTPLAPPYMARHGDRIGIVWMTGTNAASFRELDLTGAPVTAEVPVAVEPFSIVRAPDRYLIGGRISSMDVVEILPDAGASATVTLGPSDGFPRITARTQDTMIYESPVSGPTVRAMALDGTVAPTAQALPKYNGFDQSTSTLIATTTGYRAIGESAGSPTTLLRTELDPTGVATAAPAPFGASVSASSTTNISVVRASGRELVVMPYTGSGPTYRAVQSCL